MHPSSTRSLLENEDGSNIGGLCPVQILRRQTIAQRVKLLRRAPEPWRVEKELAVFRRHHAMASRDNETAEMGSGASRLLWCSFYDVQTAPLSEDCGEWAVILEMLGDKHNDDEPLRRKRNVFFRSFFLLFILDYQVRWTYQPWSYRIFFLSTFCGACLIFSRE